MSDEIYEVNDWINDRGDITTEYIDNTFVNVLYAWDYLWDAIHEEKYPVRIDSFIESIKKEFPKIDCISIDVGNDDLAIPLEYFTMDAEAE